VNKVEIPLAMSMAEKVVGLISTIYPQMTGCGIDKRILELEKGQAWAMRSSQNVLYLIDVYAQLEQYDKIYPLYNVLISIEPNNAQYYARLAAVYVATEDKEKAIEAIEKAVSLDPSLMEEAKLFIEQNNLLPIK